jgi:hypothetical protein
MKQDYETQNLSEIDCLIRRLTRACNGWPQNFGDDSETLATADAQSVRRSRII